jgi:hypothetical protein
MNNNSLIVATAIGLIVQLAMVVAGHYVPAIRDKGFAVGGMVISLAAGILYARLAHGGWGGACLGGAVAGGACALLGIAVSVALKVTPPMILAIGTTASVVAGLIGGAIGRAFG